MAQAYGATYTFENGESVITHVFPVPDDWDGHNFNGYCKISAEEAEDWFGVEEALRGHVADFQR